MDLSASFPMRGASAAKPPVVLKLLNTNSQRASTADHFFMMADLLLIRVAPKVQTLAVSPPAPAAEPGWASGGSMVSP
jgi:hypothetical protein